MGATVILYPTDNGVAMTQPVDLTIPILELARGTTPAGVPFILVDETELPDGNYFEAWSADFSEPDGYGIGPEAWAIERENAAIVAATDASAAVLDAAEENAQKQQAENARLAAALAAAEQQHAALQEQLTSTPFVIDTAQLAIDMQESLLSNVLPPPPAPMPPPSTITVSPTAVPLRNNPTPDSNN